MKSVLTLRLAFISLLFVGLSACGGKGSDKNPTPAPSPTPSSSTIASLSAVLSSTALASSVENSSAVSSSTALASSVESSSAASSSTATLPFAQSFAFSRSGLLNLIVGDVLTNQAIGNGSGAVSYISSNTAIATVDTSGLLTVVGVGEAVITATKAGDSRYLAASASYSIKATGLLQTLSFATRSITVMAGATVNNPATRNGDSPIIYSSSNTKVAVVDANGQVSVLLPGRTVITASVAADSRYFEASNFYTIYSQSVTFFNPESLTGLVGSTLYNQASAQGSGALTYSSSDIGVASVNSDGLVTLLAEGNVVITASKAADANYLGASASYQIKALRTSQSVTFTKVGPVDLLVGDTLANPALGQSSGNITYSSSDTSVAIVDNQGLVTIVNGGSAVITAHVAADARYTGAEASYRIYSGIPITAWVGSNDTLVTFPALAHGEFYRSSVADCDLANYLACANGQMSLLNGWPITDTAARHQQTGYYVLQKGQQQAKLTLNSSSGNPPTRFPFKTRDHSQTVVFNNKLWMIGGVDPANKYKNDIWSSTDGVNWKEEITHAAFSGRGTPDLLVFNNRLWLFSGYGDGDLARESWSSADGINWVKEPNDVGSPLVVDSKLAAFNHKIWLVGGYQRSFSAHSEIWSTTGKEWTLITTAAFPARRFASLSVFNNQLWLIGGLSNDNVYYNDIWSSSDGITWVQRTTNASFPARWKHTSAVYNNKLWIMGGWENGSARNDIWSSVDGITWVQETSKAPFSARVHQAAVTYNNRLMMFGGQEIQDNGYIGQTTDIWALTEDGEWRAGYSHVFQFDH